MHEIKDAARQVYWAAEAFRMNTLPLLNGPLASVDTAAQQFTQSGLPVAISTLETADRAIQHFHQHTLPAYDALAAKGAVFLDHIETALFVLVLFLIFIYILSLCRPRQSGTVCNCVHATPSLSTPPRKSL